MRSTLAANARKLRKSLIRKGLSLRAHNPPVFLPCLIPLLALPKTVDCCGVGTASWGPLRSPRRLLRPSASARASRSHPASPEGKPSLRFAHSHPIVATSSQSNKGSASALMNYTLIQNKRGVCLAMKGPALFKHPRSGTARPFGGAKTLKTGQVKPHAFFDVGA